MSELSEALERQLRKLVPLPKVTSAVSATSNVSKAGLVILKSVKSVSLGYRKGTSDKVYHVQIVAYTNAIGFGVNFQYGRRGKTLINGTKTPTPVSVTTAENIYYKLLEEKLSKGYKEI